MSSALWGEFWATGPTQPLSMQPVWFSIRRTLDILVAEQAFDRAGVIFLDTGDTRNGGPGVRLKG